MTPGKEVKSRVLVSLDRDDAEHLIGTLTYEIESPRQGDCACEPSVDFLCPVCQRHEDVCRAVEVALATDRDELIERVARAIAGFSFRGDVGWDRRTAAARDLDRLAAMRALAALETEGDNNE